jgi:hypothetical protein
MQVTPVGKLQDITGAGGKEKARRWAGLQWILLPLCYANISDIAPGTFVSCPDMSKALSLWLG